MHALLRRAPRNGSDYFDNDERFPNSVAGFLQEYVAESVL